MKTLIILALVCTALAFHHKQVASKGALCDFCVKFISGIEKFLKNEEGPIEQYAEKLCDQLTAGNPFLDPICKQLVDTELTRIIEWLNNNEEPNDVCNKLHLC